MARCLDTVIVGIDGSDASIDALRWALAHVRPDGRVRAVHVVGSERAAAVEGVAERELCDVWIPRAVGDAQPAATIDPVVVHGTVADELLADSSDADVVVVGHHAQARFGPKLVGHVTASLLHSLELPLVIVPLGWQQGERDLPVAIGVGVSRGTEAAVRWVMEHETVADGGVLLVHALGPRTIFRPEGWLDAIAYYLDPTVIPGWVERDMLDAAEQLREQTGAEVDVAVSVLPGRTGARLAEAGTTARLLVIGRGEPPFVRSHSIAPYLRHAITHAPCPILVVPAPLEP